MGESSPRKRYWPTVFLVLVTTVALAMCLLFAGYLYLPTLVTHQIPVAQIKHLGFLDFSGRISRIGMHRTEAGPFVFGRTDLPALSIDSIALDYTLGALRRKTIRRIRISDVTVNGAIGPEGIVFPGLNPATPKKKEYAAGSSTDESSPLVDMVVEEIQIRSGMVNLTWHNEIYKIPFEADLKPDGQGMISLNAHVRLFPRGQLLALDAQVDLDNRKARVRLDGSSITLDRFSDLIHLIPGLNATGNVTVQTTAMLTLTPLTLSDANVNLTWHSGRLSVASVIIEPGKDAVPASLSAVSENLTTWQIKAGGLQLQTPFPLALSMLAAIINLDGDMQAVEGKAELTILPCSIESPTPVSLKDTISLPLRFDVTRDAIGDWTAGIRTTERNPETKLDTLNLTIAGVSMNTHPPHFKLTAKGDGQGGGADWQMDLNTIRATAAGTSVNLPSINGRGQLQFKNAPLGPLLTGDARVQIPTVTVDGNGMAGKLDALMLSTRFLRQHGDAPVVDARIRLSNGRFHHRDSGLQVSGARVDLPYRSQPPATGSHGTFSVDRVVHNKRFLGKIQGRVTQIKQAYAYTATHVSDLFPGMDATLSGTVHLNGSHFPDADLNLEISPYELPAESDLGRFVPDAKGVILAGTVSAHGRASISSKGLSGDVDFTMKDGALRLAEKKIAVEGIDTTLCFPELPRIRSGPAQQIRFARAAMGGIVVDGGTFDVQLESEKTLFVEKGRLFWCGGKVDAGSLRISADKQDYQVNLYCQHLGLSRILEQLGSVNARGSGTVNGRIPIVYSNGSIRFDDGFLFSTPGEAGRIQLTGTDVLTRGIPAGTIQFAQVELAREALKDYDYTWAKLGLTSEGEEFVMRLQFDGKPANPLPFVYKKEIGSFVRVEAGAQGSIFQGIGLDVNLRLPLNQLLQYKDIINMIQ